MAEAVDLSMTPPLDEPSDAVGDTFLPAFESSLSESGPLESSDELLDEDEDEDDDNLLLGEGLDAVACFGAVKEGDSARDVEAEIGCDASGGKIVGDTGGPFALDGGFDDFMGDVFCGFCFCFCLLVCILDSSSDASDAEAGEVVVIVAVAVLEQGCFVFFFFFFKLFLSWDMEAPAAEGKTGPISETDEDDDTLPEPPVVTAPDEVEVAPAAPTTPRSLSAATEDDDEDGGMTALT